MDVDHGLLLERSEVQLLIDILLESSPEHPLDLLDIDPHPSDLILALLAERVYIDKNSGETDEAYEERLDLPEGWRLLLTGYNPDLNNGYFGAAFIHIQLQQVVVAHRGTIATEVGTLYTDVVGIFMNKYTNCMNSALTFTDHVRQVIDVVNAEPHERSYNLTITGHSLGGWLAQVTAFAAKWLKVSHGALMKNIGGGVHAKTVAFDSPGAKNILDKMRVDYYTNYGTNVLDRLDIIVYVSAPNIINTYGLHTGILYRVYIDFSKFHRKDLMETSLHNEKTHAISNFVEAFKTSSPNISEVLDWAKDSKEYRSLFEDEMLNLNNNYHVNFEKINKTEFLDEIDKHYHVLPLSNSMHLNTFSEGELHILHQLIFFQKHQRDLKVLNEFIALKNLVFKNDKIFPDFEINHANRTIKCQSKQMLEELTRRLKQLMRWLGSEFVKAVEDQIWSLPRAVDSFYRAEGESYLELLPRSTLEFKDSLGLRDFLLSDTEQILSIVTPDGEFEMSRLQNVFFQIKESVDASDPINKYTKQSHYTFLDWSHLQKLFKIYGSPIAQNNLMIIDGTSPSTINSEVRNFLNNYVQCSPSILKKLVFISSELREDIFSSLENIKEVKVGQNIGLMDLSTKSLETILQRKFILTGNKFNSFQDFLMENCSISQINQYIRSDIFKKIAFNKDYIIVIKDTRPMIYDLQMPLIKTNINITSKEHVFNCADLPKSLVVVCGLNRGDLESGAAWEQLKGKIILAEGDAELFFKDTCSKNQNKIIYLFEVSEDVIHCKQIFNQDFYVPRKFIHGTYIDLHKFTEVMHVDDMFVICSEEHKASLLGLIGNCEKREEISKNLQIAGTKDGEARVIQKYFNKNIHFVKIEQSAQNFELEWRFSHGSIKSLLPCTSTDSFEPIGELTLSRTERNLVILIDEPGMGKTTTLARLSTLIETSWVIHIELRHFKAHIDSLSDQFTSQNVAIFLLSQCRSSADDRLAHGLLEYFLQSKTCSKKVVLMFDGFDEIEDYIENKDSSKDKLVKLFNFLQSKPAIQVFLTARKYLKESLETKLNQFSTSFVTINTQEQQHFLFTFWQSFLPLELGIEREKAEEGLKEYAGEVLRRAKLVLGSDIDGFMGVPLQLRMVAEVFRPQSDLLIQPLEDLYNKINIVSAPNLYKMYVNLKYDIYLHDKTIIGKALDKDDILEYTKFLTKDHGELGFRIFFPNFYDINFVAITEKKLAKLNRLGLVQSKGNREFHFIHRTYAEYFCAQILVNWLIHQDSTFKYQLIKDILLPKILLHPDSKVIRLFMNVELEEIEMSDTTLRLNAEHISQLWFEENAIFNNEDHETALHIAVKERNEHIVALLLSGLNYKSTQKALVSFIIQHNINNDTALHIIINQLTIHGKTEDHRIMDIFLKYFETCSHKSKENILFACLFNRDISESFISNYLHKSGNISNETLTVLESIVIRVEKVKLEVSSFKEAFLKNNVKLAKNILFRRLKNDTERYCLLLLKCEDHKTAYRLAVQHGHLGVVKLLAEQASEIFSIIMTRRDNEKKTILHIAAEFGHLDIVKFLVQRRADINTCCKLGKTALMYAAYCQHELIVKYLIESGAQMNSVDNYGRTALYVAAGKNNLSEAISLIEGGADVNSRDNDGWSALHISAGNDNLSMVKYLIEGGSEINHKDNAGRTALNIAAGSNNSSIVKYLTESGAEISSEENDDRTTHQITRGNDNLSIINQNNIESGIEINSDDNDGRSEQQIVRGNNTNISNLSIVTNLIKSDSEVNYEDVDNRTTHQITRGNDNLSIVDNNIESGSEINSEDNDDWTEHQITRSNDNLSIAYTNIESGAEINSEDSDDRTEHQITRGNDNLSIVDTNVDSSTEVNSEDNDYMPEHQITRGSDNLSIVDNNIESDSEINFEDNEDRTERQITRGSDNLSIVDNNIESGTEINCEDNNDGTEHQITRGNDNLLIVDNNIESGSEINSEDNDDRTAQITGGNDNLLIVDNNIESGSEINSEDNDDRTAQITGGNDHLSMIDNTIENGAEINFEDDDGITHQITRSNDNLSTINNLIESETEINSDDNDERTGQQIVRGNDNDISNLSTATNLINCGSEINSGDNDDRTAQITRGNDHLPIVDNTIESDAEINSEDADGIAHQITRSNDNLSIVNNLIESDAEIDSDDNDERTEQQTNRGNISNLSMTTNLIGSGSEINSVNSNRGIGLQKAASENNLSVVKCLIESGAEINWKDSNGWTALHIAASKDCLSLLKYLIKSSAGIHIHDNHGRTALHVAVRNRNLSIVEYLIKRGAEIRRTDNNGWNALQTAASIDNLLIFKYLYENCADIKNPEIVVLLHIAVSYNNSSILKYLIESGAEITSKDNDGRTVLHRAVGKDNLSLVKYLIESGAEITSKDNDGSTALHIAAGKNYLSIVKYLIEIDPEVTSIKNNHGQTAFHIAAGEDSLSVGKYLIESGTEINSEDNDGVTALHTAILYNKNLSTIKYIIKKGGEIASYTTSKGVTALHIAACKDNLPMFKYFFKREANIKSKDITTLLHIAVSNNNLSIVTYLFESGAKVNCKDDDGTTPIHIAVNKNNLSTIKYLIESGAEINSVNNDGMTPLHEAVRINTLPVVNSVIVCVDAINNDDRTALDITDLSIVKHLIESGAEINLKNNDGCTVLHIASDKGHLSVVKYLLQNGADLDKVDNEGDTALTCASFKKKWDVVGVLLERGADVNADGGKALSWAISWGEWSIVKYFIDKGASVRPGDIDNEYQLSKFKEKFPNYEFKTSNLDKNTIFLL